MESGKCLFIGCLNRDRLFRLRLNVVWPVHPIRREGSQATDNQQSCYRKDRDNEESCDQTVNWYDERRSVELGEA